MTTINTIEDLVKILTENSYWREAVRSVILGEELMLLPGRFDRFVQEQLAFNARIESFVQEQRAFNARIESFVQEQQAFNARIDRFVREQEAANARYDAFIERQEVFNDEQRSFNRQILADVRRLDGNMGELKGMYFMQWAVREAPNIAMDLGLTYRRTLEDDEVRQMALNAAGGRALTPELKSFRGADLVIEATDGSETWYISVEASFTVDRRDTDRAIRNAALLTEFTGYPAKPAVAGVRKDREIEGQIESGEVFWYEIEEPR